jgi:hypothetical protein
LLDVPCSGAVCGGMDWSYCVQSVHVIIQMIHCHTDHTVYSQCMWSYKWYTVILIVQCTVSTCDHTNGTLSYWSYSVQSVLVIIQMVHCHTNHTVYSQCMWSYKWYTVILIIECTVSACDHTNNGPHVMTTGIQRKLLCAQEADGPSSGRSRSAIGLLSVSHYAARSL